MGEIDKVKGRLKEAVAEVIGDGKLAEEGKAERRQADSEAPHRPGPAERISKLT